MAKKSKFSYKKIFTPGEVHRPQSQDGSDPGDQRSSPVYVYTDEIVLAVNVGLATGRPLLVRGRSGTGKSSLARNVADFLGWRYYEKVITSRTQARDLLWEVDLLRRLHEAQRGQGAISEDFTPYIVPGVLWWAFDPQSAKWRGAAGNQSGLKPIDDPSLGMDHPRAVVLLDEIDKADPDVPNNLLVPLGSLQFQVEETEASVSTEKTSAPLVFITTNDERELPAAFLRRCVEVKLEYPNPARLIEIAREHLPAVKAEDMKQVAKLLLDADFDKGKNSIEISQAEFIDTLRAWDDLKIKLKSAAWDALTEITVWKHGRKKPVGKGNESK
jgi:MoxR-like ATPase